MSLTTIERRQDIVQQTMAQGKVMVVDLAGQYDVSTVTIRNDLNHMNRNGLLVRCRGGAIVSTRLARELSIQERYHEHLPTKQRLGRAAADMVADGESVVLDAGTTTEEVAQRLCGLKNLVVITNGLNIASALADADDIEVRITGGILRRKSMSFYGPQADESLRHVRVNKTILGADGFDAKVGISTYFEPEAALNRIMCDIADEVIVVADSSKALRQRLHIIRPCTEITTLVTDSDLSDHHAQALEHAGVKLCIVES